MGQLDEEKEFHEDRTIALEAFCCRLSDWNCFDEPVLQAFGILNPAHWPSYANNPSTNDRSYGKKEIIVLFEH